MQENNQTSPDAIKRILDELVEKDEAQRGKEKILDKEPSSGLVFDDSDDDVEPESPTPRISFEVPEAPKEKPVELFVPDKVQFGSKYNSAPTVTEEAPRIVTTYVPRFTDASVNYRMVDDPRPRTEKPKNNNTQVSDSATAELYEEIDPTAEIEPDRLAEPRRLEHEKKNAENSSESTSKVFKFSDNEPDTEVQSDVLTPTVAEEPLPTQQEPLPELEELCAEEVSEAPTEYEIPDPIEEPSAVVNYTVSSALAARRNLEDAPDGVGDKLPESKHRSFKEYTSYANRDSFKDRFLDTIMSVRVRLFAAILVAFILLWTESMFVFGVDIPLIMNLADIPGAMALLDFQFVVCLALLAFPEIIRGVKCAIGKRLVPELFLIISLSVIVAYTAVITVHSPRSYPLFGFLFSIFAISSILATYFRLSSDFTAFKRISTIGEKTVIDRKLTRTLEYENAALDGIVEEHKSKIVRTFRSMFVPDFFKRLDKPTENTVSVAIILSVALGTSAVFGVASFFLLEGIIDAIAVFALVLMVALPAASILLHKIPVFCAAAEADEEHSAFIGEDSLTDYSGVDVITFDDTEVFGHEDITLQRIMLYGKSDNLSKALRQMSALFMNVGGPLDVLFSNALDRKVSRAYSAVVEELGISGEIDGRAVCAGTMEYMTEKGLRIPEDEMRVRENLNNSTKILYAAEDGEVYAKFYIRYSFSEEFSMLLPVLEDYGITPLVYTRDPNITNELMATLTAGADKIRVLKKNGTDESDKTVYRKVSTGLVTVGGDKSNVINMIILSKRYAALSSRLAVTERIAMAVGGALALVLSLGGMATVASVALGAWHIVWCGALYFVSRRSFRKSKNKQ